MQTNPYLNVWLDDVREPPNGFWVIVRDYTTALLILQTGLVQLISFDHDLGSDADGYPKFSGYDVVRWLEGEVRAGNLPAPKIQVHSANPVGRKNIEAAAKAIARFVEEGR